jgi:hypothetical protein
LREERRLRLFENWLLRGIFGAKRDEVTGESRKLHNEELHDLYCSPNIVWAIKSGIMRLAGHVARMEEMGKRPLGRPSCRWEKNIKLDIQKIGFGGVGWIDLC